MKVRIIAPASTSEGISLEDAIAKIKNLLQSWGIEIKVGKKIFGHDEKFPRFACGA